jgi:hypothetical protein
MAREASMPEAEDLSKPFLEELLSLLQSIDDTASTLAKTSAAKQRLSLAQGADGAAWEDIAAAAAIPTTPPPPGSAGGGTNSPTSVVELQGPSALPLFGRFRKDADVESLAGSARVPPIVLPVQLSRVKDKVK